jgi:hypothetical protein
MDSRHLSGHTIDLVALELLATARAAQGSVPPPLGDSGKGSIAIAC